jgi:hypothetical protein
MILYNKLIDMQTEGQETPTTYGIQIEQPLVPLSGSGFLAIANGDWDMLAQ